MVDRHRRRGPLRGIRYKQAPPGGKVGRAVAYAGLVVVGLGILAMLVSWAAGIATLTGLGSVLMSLGLLAFIIGVGVHLLNRQGGNGWSKM